jgi:hypothetical protein
MVERRQIRLFLEGSLNNHRINPIDGAGFMVAALPSQTTVDEICANTAVLMVDQLLPGVPIPEKIAFREVIGPWSKSLDDYRADKLNVRVEKCIRPFLDVLPYFASISLLPLVVQGKIPETAALYLVLMALDWGIESLYHNQQRRGRDSVFSSDTLPELQDQLLLDLETDANKWLEMAHRIKLIEASNQKV